MKTSKLSHNCVNQLRTFWFVQTFHSYCVPLKMLKSETHYYHELFWVIDARRSSPTLKIMEDEVSRSESDISLSVT